MNVAFSTASRAYRYVFKEGEGDQTGIKYKQRQSVTYLCTLISLCGRKVCLSCSLVTPRHAGMKSAYAGVRVMYEIFNFQLVLLHFQYARMWSTQRL